MFTSVIHYKYEDPDLDETYIGSDPCENEVSVNERYFWSYMSEDYDNWKWNDTKKRYEFEGVNKDFEDDDRYGKRFHAYGVVVEIPDIDISED